MPKVLLIDPDERFRDRISALLLQRGIVSVGSGSVSEALDALKAETCACVVLDVCAKDFRWSGSLGRIRRQVRGIPIVMTTGESSWETEKNARREGVCFYHVKSFGDAELLDAVEEAAAMGEKKKPAEGPARRILVIDDDPDLQEAVRDTLAGAGYQVVQAFGKDEGKAKLASEKPDLVLLDIMMETMTAGFHFLYETVGGRRSGQPHVPILAMTSINSATGYSFSPSTDGDLFPADGFLAKPVEPKVLLERVAALLKRPTEA